MSKDAPTLTTKQRRFVEEYIGPANFNATEAAKRAGYSEKTAHSIGWENLRKPEIAEAVENRLNELSMSAAEVTKRLTDWARADPADVLQVDEYGNFVPDLNRAIETGAIRLVRELSYDSEGRPKVKLHDAKDAAIQLGKIRGLYVDRIEGRIDVSGVLKVPGVDPSEWRTAAAGNRLHEPERNGHRNGTG